MIDRNVKKLIKIIKIILSLNRKVFLYSLETVNEIRIHYSDNTIVGYSFIFYFYRKSTFKKQLSRVIEQFIIY